MNAWTNIDSGYPSNTTCGQAPFSTIPGNILTRGGTFSSAVSVRDDGDLVDVKFSDRTCSTIASFSCTRRTTASTLALDTDSDGSEGSAFSDSRGNESDESQGSARRSERGRKHRMMHEENLELGDGAQVFDMATPVGGKIKVTPGVEVFNMITPRSDEEDEIALVSMHCPAGGVSVQPGVADSIGTDHSAVSARVDQASSDSRLLDARLGSDGLFESGKSVTLPEVDAHELEEHNVHSTCCGDNSTLRNVSSYGGFAHEDPDCDHVSWESSSVGSLESVESHGSP